MSNVCGGPMHLIQLNATSIYQFANGLQIAVLSVWMHIVHYNI
jgi:hypothetical protein